MADARAALDELVREQKGLEVVTDPTEGEAKSHDRWVRSLIERRAGVERRAAAVIRPSSTAEVSALLAWAERTRTPVVPYGLGSGVCGAVLAGPGEIVVDMARMDRILEINEASLTVTVEPGMRGADFEAELAKSGLTMGHFPQSIDVSSVGGWCATRASGQFSTCYGNIEDMLLGCEVVLAGGRTLELPPVPRSATGPDLRQLFIGSEGTLGIFTRLVFRIHPLPASRRARAYTMPSMAAGLEALRLILRAGWRPAVTRLYDPTESGRHFAGSGLEGRPALLLLSEGTEERVRVEAKASWTLAEAQGGADQGDGPVESWLEHRNEIPSFDSLLDQGLVFDTIEVAAAWDRIASLYEAVVRRGAGVDGMLAMSAHVSHCYTQGANLYFTFIAAEKDAEKAIALYDKVWELVMSATHEHGGTIAHHHGIGRVRREWLGRELGAARDLLVALKTTLDPHGIMNPGVLVSADR